MPRFSSQLRRRRFRREPYTGMIAAQVRDAARHRVTVFSAVASAAENAAAIQ
jgi:hypothetical protein